MFHVVSVEDKKFRSCAPHLLVRMNRNLCDVFLISTLPQPPPHVVVGQSNVSTIYTGGSDRKRPEFKW